MVLIIKDPIQRERWEAHLRTTNSFKNPRIKHYEENEQMIISLSAEGKSVKEIRKKVPGANEKVCAVRRRARRQGIL